MTQIFTDLHGFILVQYGL